MGKKSISIILLCWSLCILSRHEELELLPKRASWWSNISLTDAIFPRISPAQVSELYSMLALFDAIAQAHHIIYWIDGGTLLGAVRHKGLIPWDDDADLEIDIQDQQKLLNLNHVFNRYGYRIAEGLLCLKMYPLEDTYPFVDIFTTRLDAETGHIVLAHPLAYSNWRLNYWLIQELQDLIYYDFGPLKLPGVVSSSRYLRAIYGTDVMSFAQCWNHKDPKCFNYGKVVLVDRTAARYDQETLRIFYDI